MRKGWWIIVAVLTTGCGIRVGVIEAPETPLVADASYVTVERKASVMGFPLPMTFLIDSVETVGLWNGQSYSFRLAPGEYIFGYFLGVNQCRRHVEIEPNRRYVFELAPNCVLSGRVVGDPHARAGL